MSLTMDDLSLALGEHGVNVNKPDYCMPFVCTRLKASKACVADSTDL